MMARGNGSRWTWILAALLGTSAATCLFLPESTPGRCADEPGSCDDGNPCTDDACAEDGYCDHVPSALVLDDPSPGDCLRRGCDAEGGIIDVPDDQDLPPDDGVECTIGRCTNGAAEHVLDEGAPCGSPSCGGQDPEFAVTGPGTCQAGSCAPPAPEPCGAYRCNGDGTGCRTDCYDGNDCTTTAFCAQGACVPTFDDGQGCDSDFQCKSGYCRDGHCCNESCEGTCRSCDGNKTDAPDGVCANITDKTDPDAECSGMCDFTGYGCCKYDGGCYF